MGVLVRFEVYVKGDGVSVVAVVLHLVELGR